MSKRASIEAGGGLLIRRGASGDELALVHRPRYDDWTFPKGKAQDDESPLETALREVEEETGLRCTVGPALGRTLYTDSKGRDKTVFYWAMRPVAGEFAANAEVDELRWVPLEDALGLLSYGRDRSLLEGCSQRLQSFLEADDRTDR